MQMQEKALAVEWRRELGLPESFVGRRPFPGLAIRVPGEITQEKLEILRKADTIYLSEIRRADGRKRPLAVRLIESRP